MICESGSSHSIYIPPAKLPYAYGEPGTVATLKEKLEDFRVNETLGFELEDSGQHLWLFVEKKDLTTDNVARDLAKIAGVKPSNVGYAGLKDRHAVTRQWFSVDLGGRANPRWEGLISPGCRVLEEKWHTKKLRRGALSGNEFDIRLRNLSGPMDDIDTRAEQIRSTGTPNYFGEQRFGNEGRNVESAYRVLRGEQIVRNRYRRGIYYSCARSLVFNQVVARRVVLGNWNRPITGDVMMLDGSRSRFLVTQLDDEIAERTRQMDVHPTGPLWGKGETMPAAEALALEAEVTSEFGDWCVGLENAGLTHDRRALRVAVRDFVHEPVGEHDLKVRFSLPPGAYATTVLRELVTFSIKRKSRRYRHLPPEPS